MNDSNKANEIGFSKRFRAFGRRVLAELELPPVARQARRIDRKGLPELDVGNDAAIQNAIEWLSRAQDNTSSKDGGVSRAYDIKSGWQTSYPETTGYIVPTILNYANATNDAALRERGKRMLDWLVQIQLPSGAFQGGKIDSTPVVPVVFNTGQILIGLAAGAKEMPAYTQAMQRAGDWLVKVQDADGCWRKFGTVFAIAGEKAYDTHTAWGLLEAARVDPNRGYGEAALANVRWAIGRQHSNGWMESCCLADFSRPLTHTLGYALRGIWEAYRFSNDAYFLESARRLGDGLLGCLRDDGFLPGRLTSNWSPAARWACLTGTVQIAAVWLELYRVTADVKYRDAAFKGTRFVRRTVHIDGPLESRGAVKGSFPVDGAYCQYEYPNWATKFLIDALVLERDVRREAPNRAAS